MFHPISLRGCGWFFTLGKPSLPDAEPPDSAPWIIPPFHTLYHCVRIGVASKRQIGNPKLKDAILFSGKKINERLVVIY